ncbi:PLDc N-terminal domain-containing protein [Planococcus salinarum]|uniref:PLDc N-terminal domain-containing protein n=1 Tax=Planococcus salinarum TaxID=622695 RepID=UPI000E3DA43F|nr:PLDc N-terminal domain-containing protein [Planococcus salinarum]TAA73532.1 PLDc_N domain-containing protein [Planococcus salinarum]
MEEPRLILLLLPVFLIQLGLMIFALVDLIKTPYTNGPKWMWAVIIIVVNIIGPILYFVMGRRNY